MDTEKHQVTEDLSKDIDRFWEDPKKIMILLDLLFLWEDPDRPRIYS